MSMPCRNDIHSASAIIPFLNKLCALCGVNNRRGLKCIMLALCLVAVVVPGGCSAGRGGISSGQSTPRRGREQRIRRVVCLYDQKPWLNIDAAGDRDPEGVRFRVFLDPGAGKGVLRDGTFHIEMYRIDRTPAGKIERTLASDWHYPTSAFQPVEAKILGMGYHLRLRWAEKDIAGHEIELITRFEGLDGSDVRSGTKRLRVPKYSS